ncbi:unnamed protein product [Heterobilharzia americana]|nr:unnamed protein product [Heterobilharzia americana]
MLDFINDEENDRWIIVLEDLEAHGYVNLAHELGRCNTSLDEKTVAWILRELILTVIEIHGCNIVHCDIKPDNIFFDRINYRLKLIDFNLASEIRPGNKILGPPGCTPDYAPPEVLIKRQPWTPASEVWSIGCTAFVFCADGFLSKTHGCAILLCRIILSLPIDQNMISIHVKTPKDFIIR